MFVIPRFGFEPVSAIQSLGRTQTTTARGGKGVALSTRAQHQTR